MILELDNKEKIAFAILQGNNGRSVHAQRIADKTGQRIKTVIRMLKDMEKKGVVMETDIATFRWTGKYIEDEK